MEKQVYNERRGLWYELQGDYYLPCSTLPEGEDKPIGVWEQRHLRYIQEHKRGLYNSPLTTCRLNSYLADIDQQAQDMFLRLVEQMAEKQGVTEKLKAVDRMAWAGKMDNIQSAAREVVNAYLIYC